MPRETYVSIKVWDLPTRLVHWALLVLFVFQLVTGQVGGDVMRWHAYAGYAMLVLIVFRILWGFAGSTHARFASFIAGPAATLRFARRLFSQKAVPQVGHNPLGGWMVIALVVSLFLQAASGLFANDGLATAGPLAAAVSLEISNGLTQFHRWNLKLLLGLTGLHVAAVLFHWVVKQENLVTAMFTGVKNVPEAAVRERREALRGKPFRRAASREQSAAYFASPRRALVLLAVAIACVFAVVQAAHAIPPEATYAGEKTCIKCHDVESKHFGHTQHAKAFRLNPRNDLERRTCEACHGPGSLHAQRGNEKNRDYLVGFTREWGTPVEQQNAVCLTCHKGGERLHWAGSAHDNTKLACSDCHNAMARFSATGLLRSASISETCQTCHGQQRAEFRKRSHMPVPEGKMSCSDCHSPHGSNTKPLLRADSVNDVCYACHAEKRGPFLWEHAPVRENCMSCHNAHGSNHDKLLVAARPYLCQQCHVSPAAHAGQFFRGDQSAASQLRGGTQSARMIGASCQNCHTQVHGSNHPSGARFQR